MPPFITSEIEGGFAVKVIEIRWNPNERLVSGSLSRERRGLGSERFFQESSGVSDGIRQNRRISITSGRVSVMSDKKSEFEQASEESRESIVAEFVDFLKYNKKWWLTPIVLVLLILVALLALAGPGSAVAPFIYTLF